MRIVPVCEREKEIIIKHIKKKKCHHRLVFFPLPIFVHSRSPEFLFVFLFFISFLSILSSLDIFLFVSLYTYILLSFIVKGSDFVYATCLGSFSFVKSYNSLWPMFCLLVVDTFVFGKAKMLRLFFFYLYIATLDFWCCGCSSVILLLLTMYLTIICNFFFLVFVQFPTVFFFFSLFRLTYLLLFLLLLLLLLQLLENIYVKNENACYYCWFE